MGNLLAYIKGFFGFKTKTVKKHKHKLNWHPSKPDPTVKKFTLYLRGFAPAALPANATVQAQCPPIVNQGDLGSCTANALAGNLGFVELQQMKAGSGPEVVKASHFSPFSRLFIYWNERTIEGTTDYDSGAELHDGIKSLVEWGAAQEYLWPYSDNLMYQQPPAKVYSDAANHKISTYYSLSSLEDMKACIASGFPFVFGFTCYDELESEEVATTGVLPMPSPDEQPIGGHAVMAVGYDDATQMFTIRNSWGLGWGLNGSGYFLMPYAYLTDANLASDFWTIRK